MGTKKKKIKKTFNPNLIKINYSYNAGDLAARLGVSTGAILRWRHKENLQTIDDRRPYMFLGAEVRRFISERRAKRKTKCGPDEMYCFKCRSPQRSIENRAEPLKSPGKILIRGTCSQCRTKMNRVGKVSESPRMESAYHTVAIQDTHLQGYVSPIASDNLKGARHNETEA
jgi:ribosomal protein L28